MGYPTVRMRRLRRDNTRDVLSGALPPVDHLVYPVFIDESIKSDMPLPSMPGQYKYPMSSIDKLIDRLEKSGIRSVLLFGSGTGKDSTGSAAYSKDGPVQKAIRIFREKSDLVLFTDLCLCAYTDTGHCGIVNGEKIDNDRTLEYYRKIAVAQAEAGADFVSPSGMMDGQVSAIRSALDEHGYTDTGIMAYSAKFASSLYGPFRDAVDSAPKFGSRKSYQMNPLNRREAMREIALDIEEGADIVMVKPSLFYLDIVHEARMRFDLPLAVYNVSGEYSMIHAAAERGWIDYEPAVTELLGSYWRAGADLIISYFAPDYADIVKKRRT